MSIIDEVLTRSSGITALTRRYDMGVRMWADSAPPELAGRRGDSPRHCGRLPWITSGRLAERALAILTLHYPTVRTQHHRCVKKPWCCGSI